MKKFICFLFAAFAIFIIPYALFGQDASPPPSGTEVVQPLNIDVYVISFTAYVASVLALVEVLSLFIKNTKIRKYLGWVSAGGIGALAYFLKLGIFFAVWYIGLAYIIVAGFVSNGYLSAEKGKLLIDLIVEWLPKLTKNSKTLTSKPPGIDKPKDNIK
jgi:hypothetical protein